MKDALTTQQVAADLEMSTSNVRYLVRTKRLTPTFRVPGKRGAMLFSPKEVDRYRKFKAALTKAEADRWAS